MERCFFKPSSRRGTGGAAHPATLIFLATATNLWQSIHHGKQRQRQARSKKAKENHTKTPSGSPRRQPDPARRHQKSRRIDSNRHSLSHSPLVGVSSGEDGCAVVSLLASIKSGGNDFVG